MANEPTRTEDAADLNFVRTVEAPRDLVFKVWTEAEHFAQWFAPRDVAIPFCRIDPRPGGALHFCHRVSDGTEVWIKGTYREFVAPERLRVRAVVRRCRRPAGRRIRCFRIGPSTP